MSDNPFAPDVVEAVAEHMNDEHEDDSLLIVRALGGVPEASEATVAHLDGTGVDFRVVVDGAQRTVRVPWSRPLNERPEIRAEFVRMYQESAKKLAITPRQSGQH
jgi:putative heme iron utilization protein